jgi:hypothetical protein
LLLVPTTELVGPPAGNNWTYYGLEPLVLPIPCDQPILEERTLRSPPSFLQTNGRQLNKVLNCPFAYYRLWAKIRMLAMVYSYPNEDKSFYGAFREPSHEALATLSTEQTAQFQEAIAIIVWEAYDIEWWFIFKERAFQRRQNTNWDGCDNVPKALSRFPVTKDSYDAWMAPQLRRPLLQSSLKYNNGISEINSLGKIGWSWGVFFAPCTPSHHLFCFGLVHCSHSHHGVHRIP